MPRNNTTVPLGSGEGYLMEYTGGIPTAPADLIGTVFAAENRVGATTGGGALSYKRTRHEEKDDFGKLSRIVIVEEAVTLGWGMFSWAPGVLDKLISTCQTTSSGTYTITKLGGLENDDGKQYIVGFKHIDVKNGNLYVIIVGTNTADLSLTFKKDDTSKLQPEFTATPLDANGHLCYIIAAEPASRDTPVIDPETETEPEPEAEPETETP